MTIELIDGGECYEVDGKPMPRVTSVIRGAGLQWIPDDPWYAAFGTAMHEATRYHDEENLDWDSLDQAIRPRVLAWEKCKSELGIKVLAIEKNVANKTFGYAGRIDRIVRIRGGKAVLDLASGAVPDWKAIQTALYARCLTSETMERLGLELRDDGNYRVKEFPLSRFEDDFRAGLACLTLYNWKRGR